MFLTLLLVQSMFIFIEPMLIALITSTPVLKLDTNLSSFNKLREVLADVIYCASFSDSVVLIIS
jgi:hypothetical protein